MSVKIKRLIRHELLNLFTVIDFAIQSSTADSEEKNKIIECLSQAILLVAHENLFLGEKLKLMKKNTSINEILEMSAHLHGVQSKKVKIQLPKNNLSANIDEHYLHIALKELITWLAQYSNHIKLQAEEKKKLLIIEAKKGKIPEIKKTSLSEPLVNREVELGLQVALEILSISKIKWKATDKIITLNFPKR